MIRRRAGYMFAAAGFVAFLLIQSLQTSLVAAGPLTGSAASDADIARGSYEPTEEGGSTVRPPEQLAKQPTRGVIAAFENASSLDGVPVVVVHERALREVGLGQGKVLMGRLPLGAGRFVTMELAPFRVVGPQTKIVVGGPDGVDAPFSYDTSQVHLLRGTVQGYPSSGVVLFSSPRGIRGHIDLGPQDQRYRLSSTDSMGRTLPPGLAMVHSMSRGAAALPDVPMCGIQTTSAVAGCCPEPPPGALFSKRLKTVEIAVETDFDLYENFNDLTATMDYIVELFARTNAIFMQEIDTRFEVVFVRLFSTAGSEKSFMNDPDPLNGYVNYWNTFEGAIARDTATFLSGRRNLPYGGVAYLGAVCTSFGYCVNGYLSGFPDPTHPNAGDYDTGVLAHELGHNFDACHTPDYCPYVDRCYPPPVFPQRGTLMSYCSQTVSGGNLMTELWYHRRLRRVMRDFIEAGASCVSYDCNQNGIDDTVDIAGGAADVNGNGIPDVCEDCNNNSILDPAEIAADPSLDDNTNGIPDDCEPDCNANGSPDDLDIVLGTSADLWGNGVPDECDPDCDGDGTPDYDEIQLDLTLDIDRNVVLDSCQDCDGDGINDLAELQGVRHAWVASDVLDYIGQYHPNSGVRVKTSTTGQVASAQDLIIAPGNLVLVTSATTNNVVAFDAVTGAYGGAFDAKGGGLSYPTGLVFGPSGYLYVCSRNTNSVLQFNLHTGPSSRVFVPEGSGGLTSPFGLTFGPNGNLFVTSGGNQVLEYDGDSGAFIRVFVSLANNGGLSGARGMLFKPDGNLLVASYNTDALIQYNGSTGASMGKWNSGGTTSALYLDGPWGLRLGLNGNVFATRDLPATTSGDNHDDHEGDLNHGDVVALHVTSARIMEFDILNGKYVRSFVVGDDTGLRSTTGFAFMPNVFAIDCNENLIQDDCDLASGSSVDININGIPDECDPTSPLGVPGDNKNRSLSLQVPPSAVAGPGAITALRVKLVDLQNPQPPNLVCCPPPDFSAYESGATCTDPGGCVRWVGKPGTFLESQDDPGAGSYLAARLQCTPLYRDWTGDGAFHVIGAEIVPSSTYHVQNLGASCQGNESSCAATSGLLVVTTARWGDIAPEFNPPSTSTQPNVLDIAQVVNKLKNVAGAPVKAVAQLQPNLPEQNADINALDIVAAVNAVKQFAYSFSGPCPCPSSVTCNQAACASPTDCGGGLCVKTCAGVANDGEPCINNTHCPGGTCGNPGNPTNPGFCRDRCGRCTP